MTGLRRCGASLLAACALVAVGCGGGASSGIDPTAAPISFEQLAASASTSAEATSGQEGSVSLAFELWDYGEAVEIDLPPAAQVADASAIGD